MDGQPVEGATMNFISEKFQASGRTGKDGRYELTQDIPPGDYRVTVRKFEGGLEVNVAEGMDEGQFEAMVDPGGSGGTKGPGPKGVPQLIPVQYSDAAKTILKLPRPMRSLQKRTGG